LRLTLCEIPGIFSVVSRRCAWFFKEQRLG
jgi:hypothetical protein